MKYKQVKIKQEYSDMLGDLDLTANKAIGVFLKNKGYNIETQKLSPCTLEKTDKVSDSGNPNHVLGNPSVTPEILNESEELMKYLILCISNIHNFLWKTQTVNGYNNPSSYKINKKSKEIWAKLKSDSEIFN